MSQGLLDAIADAMRNAGASPQVADGRNLRVRLIDASNGNIDPLSDISPIRSAGADGRNLRVRLIDASNGNIDSLGRHLTDPCIDRTGLRPRKVINAMVGAYEAWERAKRPRGRQRKYADTMSRPPLSTH